MKRQAISLFVVATPIGNLEDISPRVRQVLESVNWIAAEDTRYTLNLLRHLGIEKELVSLHEHSSPEKIEALAGRLARGEIGAYVSDAGTPGISDPGAKLVDAVWKQGGNISPIPGPSAPVAVLSASGFHFTGYTFHGFFPREKSDRSTLAGRLAKLGGVHVFFESPHRVKDFLKTIGEFFPVAPLLMGRELTKKFEELQRATAPEILQMLQEREEILGEFVFALELPPAGTEDAAAVKTPTQIRELLMELHKLGANQKILLAVAKDQGLKRSDAYDLALEILGKS